MMKTMTRFRFGGTSPTYGTFSGASGGASHSRALSSAVLFLLSILMLIPVSARAEGEDSGSGDEVTFTYISSDPAGYNASEGANNLFDGSTDTKWCFAFSNSAYVIFQASKPGIVRGYTITTGADSGSETGRNPKGWTLYGSNDEYSDNGQQTWTVIDQVSNDSKLEDKSSTPYSYTCSSYSKKEKYKYFKWEITQGGSTLQMSKFKLDLEAKFCTTHKIVKVEAKAPTCTEVGNEEYWKCTECGHAFKDEQGTDEYTDQSYVIEAKGHQVEGATCKVCGISIFKYTLNNGEVTINGFTDGCFVSDLVIPDEIEECPVVAIGKEAFRRAALTSVVIPASVQIIHYFAFRECSSLSSVTFAEDGNLKKMGSHAFYHTALTNVTIPASVETISSWAFDVESLQTVTFRRLAMGNNISYGISIFGNVSPTIYVPSGFEESYKLLFPSCADKIQGQEVTSMVFGGLRYTVNEAHDGMVCQGFANDAQAGGQDASTTDLIIPAMVGGCPVTGIAANAFTGKTLGSVSIPLSVETIEKSAFGTISSITFARIPSAEVSIEGYADQFAQSVESIYVPAGCEDDYQKQLASHVGSIYAFVEVDGLYYRENAARDGWMCMGFSGEKKDDVVIPEEVEGLPVKAIDCRNIYIDHYAFKDISSVVVPASVEMVSDRAFDDVSKLYLKRIPVADAGISGYAFYGNQYAAFTIYVPRGCEDAYKAQLPKLADAITGEDIIANNLKFMFTLDKDGLSCLGSTDQKLTELTIPASVQGCPVTFISSGVCDRMDCLEKVRLMADNVYIGDNAFLGASKLKYILVNSAEAAAKYRQMSFQRHELVVSHVEEENQVSLTDETGFAPANRFTYYGKDLLSYHRTFGESGQYATICLPFDVNLEEASGTFEKVYVPTGNMIHRVEETSTEAGASGSKELFILMLDKKELDDHIPAATPFFVKLAEGKSEVTFQNNYGLIWDKDVANKWENMKVYDWDGHTGLMEQNTSFQFSYGGNYEPKDASQEQNLWSFNTDGSFGPQTTGTLSPFRLFLRVNKDDGSTSAPDDADSPSTQARQYVITIGVSDGTATGISEIISSEKPGSGSSHASSASLRGNIYDLSGRKVGTTADTDVKKLGKGIYVVNGKKMVVK